MTSLVHELLINEISPSSLYQGPDRRSNGQQDLQPEHGSAIRGLGSPQPLQSKVLPSFKFTILGVAQK